MGKAPCRCQCHEEQTRQHNKLKKITFRVQISPSAFNSLQAVPYHRGTSGLHSGLPRPSLSPVTSVSRQIQESMHNDWHSWVKKKKQAPARRGDTAAFKASRAYQKGPKLSNEKFPRVLLWHRLTQLHHFFLDQRLKKLQHIRNTFMRS